MEGEGVRNCVCACCEGPGGQRSALGEGDGGSGIDAGGGGGGFLLKSPNTIVGCRAVVAVRCGERRRRVGRRSASTQQTRTHRPLRTRGKIATRPTRTVTSRHSSVTMHNTPSVSRSTVLAPFSVSESLVNARTHGIDCLEVGLQHPPE